MKKIFLLILLPVSLFFSCVGDRIASETMDRAEILLEAKKQLENNSDYLQVVSNLKINLSSLALQFKLNKKTLEFFSELQKQFPAKDKLWRPGGIFF